MLDERLAGRPGVFAYDPLRLAVDVRGLAASGYELAPLLREIDDINLELYGAERDRRRVRHGRARPAARRERLVDALREAVAARRASTPAARSASFARAAAVGRAGDDARARPTSARRRSSPADAAVGRIAAESLATYPPGIPNVLPGERLTAETLAYVRGTLELGGSVRGASDRLLRTVRVVVEGCRRELARASARQADDRSSQRANRRAGERHRRGLARARTCSSIAAGAPGRRAPPVRST